MKTRLSLTSAILICLFSTSLLAYSKPGAKERKLEEEKQIPVNTIQIKAKEKSSERKPSSTKKNEWFQSPEHQGFMGHSAY